MILLCCASELGLPEDLSAIEVILYYYYYNNNHHICISCDSVSAAPIKVITFWWSEDMNMLFCILFRYLDFSIILC